MRCIRNAGARLRIALYGWPSGQGDGWGWVVTPLKSKLGVGRVVEGAWWLGRLWLLLIALGVSACERGSGYVGMLVCRGQPAMPLNISGDPAFLEDLSGVPMESATGTFACYLKLTGVYAPARSP